MTLVLLLNQLESISREECLVNSFGEQAQSAVPGGLGLEEKQLIRGSLSAGVIAAEAVRQVIAGDGISSLQNLRETILEKDVLSGIQSGLQSIGDPVAVVPVVSWDVYLDGVSIKTQATRVAVSFDEDSVHNSVEIASFSSELFKKSNPSDLFGASRIEVHVGTRVLFFLLESRGGSEVQFSLWGRSLSATEDYPYASEMIYALVEPKLASEAAGAMVSGAVDWQCDDWVLPADFEFGGAPLDGVVKIANAVGAVVRCKDDGTILVRKRFQVRPINFDIASPAVSYDRETSLISLSYTERKGTGNDAVEVLGATDDVNMPDAEVEGSPIIEEDAFVRLYWAGRKPIEVPETYVTDGLVADLGEVDGEEEETVVFEDGKGRASKPVTSLVSVSWIGDDGGDVGLTQYDKELSILEEADRVGKIKYVTTYQRYRLYGHDVETLLLAVTISTSPNVSVLVKFGEGISQARSISEPLLTDENVAVSRGVAWLDENSYDKLEYTISAPYLDAAIDGVLAYLNDGEVNAVGNHHVKRASIEFDGPRVTNRLEVIRCLA